MYIRKAVVGFTGISLALCCGAWDRLPAPTTRIELKGTAQPPAGYNAFCATHQVECVAVQNAESADRSAGPASTTSPQYWRQIFLNEDPHNPLADAASGPQSSLQAPAPIDPDGASVPRLPLDRNVWAALNRVNREVNEALKPPADAESFRLAARWVLALSATSDHVGNCKDAAIEKRHQLIAAGIPSAALAIAVVRTLNGQAHAVLVFHAQAGDYVLDSASPWISPWRALDYRWIAMETPHSPTRWSAVQGPEEPIPVRID